MVEVVLVVEVILLGQEEEEVTMVKVVLGEEDYLPGRGREMRRLGSSLTSTREGTHCVWTSICQLFSKGSLATMIWQNLFTLCCLRVGHHPLM